MHRYLMDEHPHFFYPTLAERLGLNEAIVLQQIHSWIQTYTKDVRVGTWTTVIQSGMLAPTEKARLMSRLDALLRAVRQARQRANDHEIIKEQVAERIFRYIHEQ